MRLIASASVAALVAAVLLSPLTAQPPKASDPAAKPDSNKPALARQYVKKGNRAESIRATLAAFGLPNLEGKWYYIGPFDNTEKVGFDTEYPPEKKIDLAATYSGKGGVKASWKEYRGFKPGVIMDLAKLFPNDKFDAVVYLYHAFESPQAFRMKLSFGSDDTLSVFFNGNRLVHEPHFRAAAPDQDFVDVDVKAGKNELLIKICQEAGGWEAYVNPAELPSIVPDKARVSLTRDFPANTAPPGPTSTSGEANYYKLTTIPLPPDCILEVGGLAFRPDGKLLACTRRGEVWLIDHPTSDSLADVKFSKFASGLHEALGLWVQDNNTVFAVQRPELTKLVDRTGEGIASEFTTVCDKWGVSGDYHEFAFGPARDKDGCFYITLNVGFGGGHQAKAPWRGWCVKVHPDGKMEPYAYGLRSPNGINFAPDGELFYADNQGEWVATNKLHHLKKGQFYGHQAGLRWVKESPFADKSDKVASGMLYDGTIPSQKKWYDLAQFIPWVEPTPVYPDLDPPCIWFPYGRMGQSVSEPVWDTTGGKFGPFEGQCFAGDQTKSMVMRVALEKVNGVYQGACFPFRSGLQCGVNRLAFAPDGSLMVGQTNRGWGSLGGKPYGLQRIAYDGKLPLEIHHIAITKDGFDLVFTKPIDPKTIGEKPVSVSSFTYLYYSNYGCPEMDQRFETVSKPRLSEDGKTLSVSVGGRKKGRIYEIRLDGLATAEGEKVLHPEAYYTINELVK
jgi:hypothetical protein